MKINVPFFPMLTDELLKEIRLDYSEYSLFYTANSENNPLTLKPITVASKHEIPTYNLIDERGEWDAVHFDAIIEREIRVENTLPLFGSNGIAVHNAQLGIAVLISSLTSNHRYAVPVTRFSVNEERVHETFRFTLEKNIYRERISLKTVLYVYSAGTPASEEMVLANLPGTLLGTIDEIAVYIDGTGSLFPVKKESDPTKPLWRVECDWADPYNDLFSEENVCVIFNQAHPNYGMLKIENGMNGSPFLSDVIASALQIIITKTVESIGSMDELNSNNAIPGSILDAVRYFISTFGWDPTSPEKLAETIRLDFDRRTSNDK